MTPFIITAIIAILIIWPVREKTRKANFRCEIRTENEMGVFWKHAAELSDLEDAKKFCTAAAHGAGSVCRVMDKRKNEIVFVSAA